MRSARRRANSTNQRRGGSAPCWSRSRIFVTLPPLGARSLILLLQLGRSLLHDTKPRFIAWMRERRRVSQTLADASRWLLPLAVSWRATDSRIPMKSASRPFPKECVSGKSVREWPVDVSFGGAHESWQAFLYRLLFVTSQSESAWRIARKGMRAMLPGGLRVS